MHQHRNYDYAQVNNHDNHAHDIHIRSLIKKEILLQADGHT